MSEDLFKIVVFALIMLFLWVARKVAEAAQKKPSGPEGRERRTAVEEQLREFFRQIETQTRGEEGPEAERDLDFEAELEREPEPPPERVVVSRPSRPSPTRLRAPARKAPSPPPPPPPAPPRPRVQPTFEPPQWRGGEVGLGAEEREEEEEVEAPLPSIQETIDRDLADRVGMRAEAKAREFREEGSARWARPAPTTHMAGQRDPLAPLPQAGPAQGERPPAPTVILPLPLGLADMRLAVLLSEAFGPPLALRPPGGSTPGLPKPWGQ